MVPVFLAGSFAGALGVYLALRSSKKGHAVLDNSATQQQQQPGLLSASTPMDALLEDEILTEQFTRNVQFFGKEGQLQVARAFVVVIGLGVSTFCPYIVGTIWLYCLS